MLEVWGEVERMTGGVGKRAAGLNGGDRERIKRTGALWL